MLASMHRFIGSWIRAIAVGALSAVCFFGCAKLFAQDTPLISGGVGFITITNGGNTTYLPTINPLLAAPLGDHLLVESRGNHPQFLFPEG